MKAGWEPKKFGEVLDIRNGRNQREVESDMGQFPILGSAGKVMGYATDYLCEAGTTIIGRKGTINSPIYVESRFWNVDTAFGLAPKPALDSKFLYYFCLSYDFSLLNCGTTIPSLVKTDLLKIEIPLPLLDEQRRIVAVLDKAFANIATATANAQNNLTNARALFESYLRSVFDAPHVDWQQSTLGKLTSKIGSGATPRGGKDAYKADGTPLIRSMNVHDRYFKDRNLAFIDDNQARLLNNVIVQENDVLLNITGASVARCCLAPMDMAGARVNQHVAIIRTNADKIMPEFLELALTSPHYKDILLGVGEKGGSTRQAITKAEIQNLEVAFPALIDQDSFVDHATDLQVETRKLATVASQKLAALTELKQSLLHKAFAGELT